MHTIPSALTSIWFWLISCLTLGLAPYLPEPHVVGKIRWLLGGATGMKLIDWGDLALHGLPWLGLLGSLIWHFTQKKRI